jgi:hypothetical protein
MRRLAGAAMVSLVILATAGPASAAWGGDGSGFALAGAATIPAGNEPTGVVAGRNVSVQWTASALPWGPTASGYVVRRYAASGAEQATGDDCAGTVLATTCTERNLSPGAWRYTVAPKHGNWVGEESAKSTAVNVASPSLTLTPSDPTVTSSANTLSGQIAGFLDGETIRFRLDGSSGALLSGTVDGVPTPAPVPSGGAAAVTVTVPNGTADGPHTVFAVAAPSGEASSASFSADMTPATLTSLEMFDANANGRVDRVVAGFSAPISCPAPCTAPWTLSSVPSGGSLSSVSISGSQAVLYLNEGGGAADTAGGSFTVSLASSASGIRDAQGNRSSFGATAPADRASPLPVALTESNVGATDGAMESGDRLTITFSEALASSSVPASVTVTERDPAGSGNDTLTIVGVANGARSTGSDGYIKNDNTSNSFSPSTTSLSGGQKVLTVTVAGSCSPASGANSCANNIKAGGPGILVFVPASTLADVAGNGAIGTVSASFRLF